MNDTTDELEQAQSLWFLMCSGRHSRTSYTCLIPIILFFFFYIIIWVCGYGFGSGGGGGFSWILGGGGGCCAVGEGGDYCVMVGLFVLLLLLLLFWCYEIDFWTDLALGPRYRV